MDKITMERVSAEAFRAAFAAAYAQLSHADALTDPLELELEGASCYLSDDDCSGFVITGGDARYLFSTVKGRGDRLVSWAVQIGARTLDCFDGYLVKLYSRHGFHVTRRVPNWHRGGPDVVYMAHDDSY